MRALLIALSMLAAFPAAAVEPHAVVFMYHRFGNEKYPSTNVRMDQFRAQLDYLADNGYQVWPLQRVVTALRDGAAIPDDTVALAVDDAYDTFFKNAYPLIKARGWPMTVFVSTGEVDRGFPSIMTWDQMREMSRHGVTFANHTADHAHLTRHRPGETDEQWLQRVSKDIEKAQQRLQAELGQETNTNPKLFAYPYGEYNTAVAGWLRDHGYIAFGQESGVLGPQSDMRALPRYPINEHYGDLRGFIVKAKSLPLPVADVEPWDPEQPAGANPRMEFRVEGKDVGLDRLSCYLGGDRLPLERLSKDQFAVQAPGPLPPGRSRYNCTAPAKQGNRYYWYSHMWLLPGGED